MTPGDCRIPVRIPEIQGLKHDLAKGSSLASIAPAIQRETWGLGELQPTHPGEFLPESISEGRRLSGKDDFSVIAQSRLPPEAWIWRWFIDSFNWVWCTDSFRY